MAAPDLLDFDVRTYLRALYKRRWLAGACFVIVFVAALVYAVTATPIYRASARLLIDEEDPNVVTFQQVVRGRGRLGLDFLTTHRDMLRSRALAGQTIDRLDLWGDPVLIGRAGGWEWPQWLDAGRAVERLVTRVRSAILPPVTEYAGTAGGDAASRPESQAISALLARLDVRATRNSRVVTVRYTSMDPRLAADVLNTLLRIHVEQDMEFRYTSSRDASEWLDQRIAEQRDELEARERALQRYREEHSAAALEDRQDIVVRELENLHSAATQSTLARIESEARYRDLQAALGNPEAVARFPEVLRNEFVQDENLTLSNLRSERARLAEELGPRHPDMVSIESSVREAEDRLQSAVDAVVESLRIEFEVARSQEQQLQVELDARTEQALALDRTGIEYNVMRREAESTRQLYESLLQRAAETGVTGELETSNIRIIDEAEVPTAPVRPRRQLVLLIGLLGGLGIAVGLVGLLEYLDDRIKTPEDIKNHLEVPYLGMVPFATSRNGQKDAQDKQPRRRDVLVGSGAPSSFVEAVRSVRTNLVFSSAEEGCRTVLVTSTAPAEGKSCVSANLAISLAQLGLRTLLVDADLRRPQQHSQFGAEAEPGLSNLIVGDAEAGAVVRETAVEGLALMPAGAIPPNPIELLGSERFRNLMQSLGEHFDWIVFDSPPVLPIADAQVIAKVARGALFVVAADNTSRRVARDALQQLAKAGAHVYGAVFNKANLSRHPYYYSRYYRRSYERYYHREAQT